MQSCDEPNSTLVSSKLRGETGVAKLQRQVGLRTASTSRGMMVQLVRVLVSVSFEATIPLEI